MVRGQDVVPSGPSKTFLASAARPEAASIAQRDHRLPENVNIEKVGPTYFLNLFRTVISFFLPTLSIVCRDTCKTWEGQRPRCPYGGESWAARTLPLPNLQGFASASVMNLPIVNLNYHFSAVFENPQNSRIFEQTLYNI